MPVVKISDVVDALFLDIAANTPIPHDANDDTNTSTPNPICSIPITQTHLIALAPVSAATLPLRPTPSQGLAKLKTKKRTRNADFSIFVDPNQTNSPPKLVAKRFKTRVRIPLAPRQPPPNATVVQSRRGPDTPFPFSNADPSWEDTGDYHSHPNVATRPNSRSPMPDSVRRQIPSPRPSALPAAPRSMALYNLLGLDNWTASTEDIVVAWRRLALDIHPDRVAEEERAAATLKMQRLNAAKELLADHRRRRRYRADGSVPWSE